MVGGLLDATGVLGDAVVVRRRRCAIDRRVVEDHAEQVVEVVGDAAREAAEALHALGLEVALARDVGEREHDAGRFGAALLEDGLARWR